MFNGFHTDWGWNSEILLKPQIKNLACEYIGNGTRSVTRFSKRLRLHLSNLGVLVDTSSMILIVRINWLLLSERVTVYLSLTILFISLDLCPTEVLGTRKTTQRGDLGFPSILCHVRTEVSDRVSTHTINLKLRCPWTFTVPWCNKKVPSSVLSNSETRN